MHIFALFYLHVFTKSRSAGRIQVCLTVRIKFTSVPAETAGEISFKEIRSKRDTRFCAVLKFVQTGAYNTRLRNRMFIFVKFNQLTLLTKTSLRRHKRVQIFKRKCKTISKLHMM